MITAVAAAWRDQPFTRDTVAELGRAPYGAALLTDLLNALLAERPAVSDSASAVDVMFDEQSKMRDAAWTCWDTYKSRWIPVEDPKSTVVYGFGNDDRRPGQWIQIALTVTDGPPPYDEPVGRNLDTAHIRSSAGIASLDVLHGTVHALSDALDDARARLRKYGDPAGDPA